ncbi:MAG: hypothetical protein HQ523_00335 [Lentisphaerae bacterium]|nr:hypothetical protein [Lentisphaerota bacterium]
MISIRRRTALAAMLLLATGSISHANDEQAFWAVWKLQSAPTNQPTEVIAACEAFETAAPADPLAIVARQFRAWQLLKLGRHGEAAALLSPMIKRGANGIDQGAADIARAWLTRLDAELVKAALQKLYLRDVAYPAQLDVWADTPTQAPPLVDRWSKSWDYRLVGFEHLPGLRNQKYRLQSNILRADSELAPALARPYADRIDLQPLRLKPMAAGAPLVEFKTNDQAGQALLASETHHGDILFAYMGDHILLLADHDHWKAVARPR